MLRRAAECLQIVADSGRVIRVFIGSAEGPAADLRCALHCTVHQEFLPDTRSQGTKAVDKIEEVRVLL